LDDVADNELAENGCGACGRQEATAGRKGRKKIRIHATDTAEYQAPIVFLLRVLNCLQFL
jgi:hypothetical protein